MTEKYVRTAQLAVLFCLKLLSYHSPGETNKTHKMSQYSGNSAEIRTKYSPVEMQSFSAALICSVSKVWVGSQTWYSLTGGMY
jgi:hypothetical protein